jgi:uncharacterized protein (TIGR02246 family)
MNYFIRSAVLTMLMTASLSGETQMTPEELTDFAKRYTAAWNSQNPASVAEFFAEEGTLFVNGVPSAGREAITVVAEGFMTAFPDMVLIMGELTTQPDEIVTYNWTFIGTNTGPEGTGMAVNFSGYEEWSIGEDGLITQSLGHFDNDEYQYQLQHGVGGAKP